MLEVLDAKHGTHKRSRHHSQVSNGCRHFHRGLETQILPVKLKSTLSICFSGPQPYFDRPSTCKCSNVSFYAAWAEARFVLVVRHTLVRPTPGERGRVRDVSRVCVTVSLRCCIRLSKVQTQLRFLGSGTGLSICLVCIVTVAVVLDAVGESLRDDRETMKPSRLP